MLATIAELRQRLARHGQIVIRVVVFGYVLTVFLAVGTTRRCAPDPLLSYPGC